MIAVDAIGVTALGAGIKLDSAPLLLGGATAMLLGAGVVHLAHGEYEHAGYSAARRVGLVLLGAAIGTGVSRCTGFGCLGNPAQLVGLGVGCLAAAVLDNVFPAAPSFTLG